jgi:hypothetical protein
VSIVVGIIGRKVYGGCYDRCLVSIDGVEAEELFYFIGDLSRPGVLENLSVNIACHR